MSLTTALAVIDCNYGEGQIGQTVQTHIALTRVLASWGHGHWAWAPYPPVMA